MDTRRVTIYAVETVPAMPEIVLKPLLRRLELEPSAWDAKMIINDHPRIDHPDD
jgi:hypothetical protein